MAPTRHTSTPAKDPLPQDALPVRERLLGAAVELVRTQGLQGFSQARVAAAAGLRQSHLTYYFPTRKDLLQALVETIHAELKQAIGALLSDDRTSSISVDTICDFFAPRIGNPLLARLMVALTNAANEDPSLRRWMVGLDNDLIGQLGDIFARADLYPKDEALTLLHTNFIGIAMMAEHDDSRDGAERAAHLTCLAIDRLVQSVTDPAREPACTSGNRKRPR